MILLRCKIRLYNLKKNQKDEFLNQTIFLETGDSGSCYLIETK